MKILVTGASGFIGSQLVPFLNRRHEVSALNARRVSNTDTEWRDQVDGCDVLVHLAGRAHVSSNVGDAQIYKTVNTDLTETLANQAAQTGKHMIFISSALVYGDQSINNEKFNVDDTLWSSSLYASSKIAAEVIIQKIHEQLHLSFTIVRPPAVYGPRVKANFLSMLNWVNSGIPLPLGSVNNLRSLVGVRNLLDLIENCAINDAAKNQVFNVSDDLDISTTDLLKIIATSMDKRVRLIKMPLPVLKLGSKLISKPRAYDGLCGSFQLDISRTKQTLGWKPPFSLHEEIAATVAWYQGKK